MSSPNPTETPKTTETPNTTETANTTETDHVSYEMVRQFNCDSVIFTCGCIIQFNLFQFNFI
jgi:hypothetical protein